MNSTLKLLFCLSALMPISSFAQDDALEKPWEQRDRKTAQPLEYEYVREADVMWSKTLWRTIDIREKVNLPFGYPQRPLIEILHRAAIAGDITAYDPAVERADQFRKVLTPAEVAKIGSRKDSMEIINVETREPEWREINNPLTWDKITKYKIKEVMFFDTKTSSMQVRIIGIAPVMEDYDANGNYRGDLTMYWLHYADLRNMLSKEEAFNPQNDQKSLSWDDIFESRMFESYIYKESNVYDRAIAEYATGKDLQLESDRIKQKNFEFEHDLWNY
jgi:gliding motility associated protien GldN